MLSNELEAWCGSVQMRINVSRVVGCRHVLFFMLLLSGINKLFIFVNFFKKNYTSVHLFVRFSMRMQGSVQEWICFVEDQFSLDDVQDCCSQNGYSGEK